MFPARLGVGSLGLLGGRDLDHLLLELLEGLLLELGLLNVAVSLRRLRGAAVECGRERKPSVKAHARLRSSNSETVKRPLELTPTAKIPSSREIPNTSHILR